MTREPFPVAGIALSACTTGSGVPFVFQHGMLGDAKQPAGVFPDGTGFSCLTLECRGHGASQLGSAEAISLATYADDLIAFIESLGAGPVVLGGISMGAALSMRIASLRPDLMRGLVLARPAWLFDAAPDNMVPNLIVGELMRDHSPEEARALFEASDTVRQLEETGPDNLSSLRGFFDREPRSETIEVLLRIPRDGPGVSCEDLAALAVPTLVIGHERDHIHPWSYAQALGAAIPGAKLAEITPKATDAKRYTEDFRAALSSFLAGIDR